MNTEWPWEASRVMLLVRSGFLALTLGAIIFAAAACSSSGGIDQQSNGLQSTDDNAPAAPGEQEPDGPPRLSRFAVNGEQGLAAYDSDARAASVSIEGYVDHVAWSGTGRTLAAFHGFGVTVLDSESGASVEMDTIRAGGSYYSGGIGIVHDEFITSYEYHGPEKDWLNLTVVPLERDSGSIQHGEAVKLSLKTLDDRSLVDRMGSIADPSSDPIFLGAFLDGLSIRSHQLTADGVVESTWPLPALAGANSSNWLSDFDASTGMAIVRVSPRYRYGIQDEVGDGSCRALHLVYLLDVRTGEYVELEMPQFSVDGRSLDRYHVWEARFDGLGSIFVDAVPSDYVNCFDLFPRPTRNPATVLVFDTEGTYQGAMPVRSSMDLEDGSSVVRYFEEGRWFTEFASADGLMLYNGAEFPWSFAEYMGPFSGGVLEHDLSAFFTSLDRLGLDQLEFDSEFASLLCGEGAAATAVSGFDRDPEYQWSQYYALVEWRPSKGVLVDLDGDDLDEFLVLSDSADTFDIYSFKPSCRFMYRAGFSRGEVETPDGKRWNVDWCVDLESDQSPTFWVHESTDAPESAFVYELRFTLGELVLIDVRAADRAWSAPEGCVREVPVG